VLFTPHAEHAVVSISGATARAGEMLTFRGADVRRCCATLLARLTRIDWPWVHQAFREISCGAHHVVGIHESGDVYTWGLG
jgi:hypothetical protein